MEIRYLSQGTTMTASRHPNLRSIALPAEHGGWGFLLEPILLALLVAPSWWGLLLSIAIISLFLMHQPLKLAIKDNLKQRRVERTPWAERFVLFYGGIGIGIILLIINYKGLAVLYPLIAGSSFALIQLSYDARNRSREIIPELSGAFALAATASSMALLAGWQILPSAMLWLLLAARALTAIVYVRARLRLAFKRSHNKVLVYWLHLGALIFLLVLSQQGYIPVLSLSAMVMLSIRAYKGLAFPKEGVKPKAIGFGEMGFGFAYTLLVAVGYWINLL